MSDRSKDIFRFKQFEVAHNCCAMKISTVACILGACTQVPAAGHVLDVGTGSGLLALMLAQRTQAAIDAVEIDPEAAAQATENFANSPWRTQLRIIAADIQAYAATCSRRYDLIISNPPFYARHLVAASARATLARHQTGLNAQQLLQAVDRLLKPEGTFWVLLPPKESVLIQHMALPLGMHVRRQLHIHAREKKPCLAVVSALAYTPGPVQISAISVRTASDSYTEAYRQLLSSYMLDF